MHELVFVDCMIFLPCQITYYYQHLKVADILTFENLLPSTEFETKLKRSGFGCE